MTEEERQKIIGTICETLLPEDQKFLGAVYENPSSAELGIWVEINQSKAFFGSTIKAALFTARQADWWYPLRDGKLLKDDYEWFEQRAELGEKWKESEPKMMKAESRTRIALNIQMETGIPQHDPLDFIPSKDSNSQNVESDSEVWNEDPLEQIEFLRVKGWEGLWFLHESKTMFRNIRLAGTHEGYRVHMGEFREWGPEREYDVVARLTCDDEEHLVKLEFLDSNSDDPCLILEQNNDGQIIVKKINLG
ncbi:hypothetical protein [Gimesia panareensis]|nr:hypothetical protein [Gimesia panareensis]